MYQLVEICCFGVDLSGDKRVLALVSRLCLLPAMDR